MAAPALNACAATQNPNSGNNKRGFSLAIASSEEPKNTFFTSCLEKLRTATTAAQDHAAVTLTPLRAPTRLTSTQLPVPACYWCCLRATGRRPPSVDDNAIKGSSSPGAAAGFTHGTCKLKAAVGQSAARRDICASGDIVGACVRIDGAFRDCLRLPRAPTLPC